MTIPLVSTQKLALFIDFDGTLAPIAPTPDAVQIPAEVVPVIHQLHGNTQGAIALITGRSLASINALLNLKGIAVAGSHGAEWQLQDQRHCITEPTEAFGPIRPALEKFAQSHNLLLEDKGFALAVHFRQAPDLEETLDEFLKSTVPEDSPLTVLHGKAIREVKPRSVGKGLAIARFMQTPPFAHRTPYYLGDDVTDEAGFEWINQAGGISIKVGPGPTCAQHRLADPDAVLLFLNKLLAA